MILIIELKIASKTNLHFMQDGLAISSVVFYCIGGESKLGVLHYR